MDWLPVLVICGIFILIALVINENNARYLLAGYNTMPEEIRKNYDIKGFLKVFKRLFLILGIAVLVLYGLLVLLRLTEFEFIVVGIIPLMAILYLVIRAPAYYHDKSFRQSPVLRYLGIVVLVFAIFIVSIEFKSGLTESRLVIEDDHLTISGMYGEEIQYDEIKNIELTNTLPTLVLRTNGFAAGTSKKGYFKTSEGETIKLFVNTGIPRYLKIVTGDGTYFWNSGKDDMDRVLIEIKKHETIN